MRSVLGRLTLAAVMVGAGGCYGSRVSQELDAHDAGRVSGSGGGGTAKGGSGGGGGASGAGRGSAAGAGAGGSGNGGSGGSGGSSGSGGAGGFGGGGRSGMGGAGGTTPVTGGVGGGSAGPCFNDGVVNYECPFTQPPITGSCAPAGECCHRSSNVARVDMLEPDEPAELEFRLRFVEITNHPESLGLPDLLRLAQQRADVCSGEQCLLWRFTMPREGGELVAGHGSVEIGVGSYNCDGTYSFYGPFAAPDRTSQIGEGAPDRWQAMKVDADFDPSRTGRDRFHIPWAANRNRELTRSLFILPSDNSVDWELASSGFEITGLAWNDDVVDCMGSRDGFVGWNTVSGFELYAPLLGNDTDILDQIDQTYCALLGFGLLPEGMKDEDCLATQRCLPDGGVYGDGGCDWIKLPDSLCPQTEEERALWGCHLGAEGNPNGEDGYPATLACMPEAPSTQLDPDMGVTTTGQCCDPLGQSATLPACNAYRLVGRFVATAAEITDEPRNGIPRVCN